MATPLTELIPLELLPTDQLTSEESPLSILERILVTKYEAQQLVPGPGDNVTVGLTVADEAVLSFPGLDGVALVIGGADASTLEVGVRAAPGDVEVRISGGARLRFPREWLRPVVEQDGKWVDDPSRQFSEIGIEAAIIINQDWAFSFDGTNEFALQPAMIADTGFVIEGLVAIDLSDTESLPETLAMGLGDTWRGVVLKTLTLHLPSELDVPILPQDLTLTNFHIGSGGISGSIRGDWSPTITGSQISGSGAGKLFGIPFGLTKIEIDLLQNAVTGMEIKGVLALPFFEHAFAVELGLDLDGNFSITVDNDTGLAEFTIGFGATEVMHVKVASLSVEHFEGVLSVGIGGTITPKLGGLDWPSFDVQKLTIDSDGNVRLDGGWLDLREQYAIDFYGFKFEITKLGLGKTDDGGKWVGFSGGLKLVDGLSAGASVEGLRLTWYENDAGDIIDTSVSFNGVGIEFEVPEVLRFQGAVSYRKLPGEVHRFDGAIKLSLMTLGLEIDAQLVVGYDKDDGYTFFAIYLGIDLPAGIPLWATGLALYGLEGLFALQMEPDKVLPEHADEQWYAIGGENSWFHRPPVGVSDLSKWTNRQGSLGLGGGVTIGTLADNGFTFSGRMLLVIIFPGPILMIEGAASILKERSSLKEEPVFRALAVLDGRSGIFLVGLDAHYKYDEEEGRLIEIGGSVEAFFSISDANAWHLYIGQKEPREKRIRAEILSLFKAESYFMLDAKELAMGAWVGYDKRWSFGPLSVTLEAWIDGNTIISWKPAHLYGDLWLHGKVALSVFGFGLALSLDARFAADVFDPFHVRAEFEVVVDLPWFLPDVDVNLTLEWGPDAKKPLLPMPLKEVAVEHFKVTTSWPLRRGALLLPVYDGDAGGANADGLLDDLGRDGTPDAPVGGRLPSQTTVPVVPLDARPHITFGRAVHDDALVGVNAQPVSPVFERIGDPEEDEGPVKVRYGLQEVTLEKWNGNTWNDTDWTPVASKRSAPNTDAPPQWSVVSNPGGVDELWGSWAPVPALPAGNPAPGTDPSVANVKLWLWSITPFDYTRHTGRAWDEWFTDRFSDYPCIPDPPDRVICCDFEHLVPGDPVESPYSCGDRHDIEIVAVEGGLEVMALDPPVRGKRGALCPTTQNWVDIFIGVPAQWVEVTVAPDEYVTFQETCIDFREQDAGTGPNPLVLQGTTFLVLDLDGQPQPVTQIQDVGNGRGLYLGYRVQVDLPCPASDVRLTLSLHASEIEIEALDANKETVSSIKVAPDDDAITVTLGGERIVRLIIAVPDNETWLHELCFTCEESRTGDITASGFNAQGRQFGPFQAHDNVARVEGEDLRRVRVQGERHACVVQVCANIGPDPVEKAHREEMAEHLVDELARWDTGGEVLQPYTTYRIKIVTTVTAFGEESLSGYSLRAHEIIEYAYFRTEGPPGLTTLSVPDGQPNPDEFQKSHGLNDLTLYVEQTVPPTVPASGEKPLLPRPVYRAYDVGVDFNEDYVDLMYLIAQRDLGLYLYDNNNRPVRDALGRLIVLGNRWGEVPTLTLTESEDRYISVLNSSDCVMLDPTVIPHDKTLTASDAGQVLDPDTLYEARLIPLLLHDGFNDYNVGDTASGPSGTLGGWQVVDSGANSGPSQWQVGETGAPSSRYLEQTSNIYGGTDEGYNPAKPGTTLVYLSNPTLPPAHADQPAGWTDYRFSVFIRSADDDAIGMVFRYQDADNHYRFSMDRERKYRRLVRFVEGNPLVLAEDDFVYRQDQDYLITVEAIGDDLSIYQDGDLVFRVTDPALNKGAIGLYCWASEGARFTDVRVDDFRVDAAPVVYRFEFVTSNFAHFLHHLHSYQDETWGLELDAGALSDTELGALVAAALAPSDAPTEDEGRAYEALAKAALGAVAHQNPAELQVSRVDRDGETIALLVESPEPIDWARTDLTVERTDRESPLPELPDALKLVGVTFGNGVPNDESVALLLRDAADLTGHQIQYRALPGVLDRVTGNPILFSDDFEDGERGLLFREPFGSNALDKYTISDSAQYESNWRVVDGHITVNSRASEESVPVSAGTMAITGSPTWRDVRITAGLRLTGSHPIGFYAIGVIFRYKDADNFYYFYYFDWTEETRGNRGCRLGKKVAGSFTTLWRGDGACSLEQLYELTLEAHGDRLLGFLEDRFLFSVQDAELENGQVGLYSCCWDGDAHFEKLEVEALETPPLLWEPEFTDLSELTIVDAAGAISGPSQWNASGGVLTQTSNIYVSGSGSSRPGTYAVGGSDTWRDVQFSVRLRSTDNDAIGVLFRYVDDDNYYRFSMDRQRNYRRLIKKAGGTVAVLWQDSVAYTQNRHYDLTIRAVGPRLTGYLDGVQLFNLADGDLARGAVGFYCWANEGAAFDRVIVTDKTRRLGPWTIRDNGTMSGPSVWQQRGGALQQTANIYDGSPVSDIVKAGTYAVAGSSSWIDYRLAVRLRSDDDDAIGVMVRYVDDDNYYRLSLDSQRNYRRLVKKENGVFTTLWEDANGFTVGEPFTLTLDVAGSRLVGYLGESQLFDVTDSAHAAGRVGLYGWLNTGMRFEHVEVRRLPLEAYALFRDRFGFSDMSAWSIVDEGTVSTPSNWAVSDGALRQSSNIHSFPLDPSHPDKKGTQVVAGDSTWTDVVLTAELRSLDDDAIGIVFRYADADNYYRFSMDNERSYRRLVKNVGGTFTVLWEDDFAYEIGRTYKLTIVTQGGTLRGYLDDVPMFVVEDADLVTGRIGLYCWRDDDARFSNVRVYPVDRLFDSWLLDESFDVETPGRWTSVGNEEDQTATSAVAGDASWTDYRVSACPIFLDDDKVWSEGTVLIFRYQDLGNWYYFFVQGQQNGYGYDYWRLSVGKVVAGILTTLWEGVRRCLQRDSYIITADCMGSQLRVYLNGVELVAIEDADLASGGIGLICSGDIDECFTEVRVAEPAWCTYYTFCDEEHLPAGTRLRVHAGNVIAAPPEEPNTQRRFVARLEESGQIRFPATGVDLRLVDPADNVGHSRRFLPDDVYGALVNVKMLRKADGTGFFLFLPANTPVGSRLPAGQYRLTLTYRRDNTALDAESIVFKEVGDSAPETVTLDIP